MRLADAAGGLRAFRANPPYGCPFAAKSKIECFAPGGRGGRDHAVVGLRQRRAGVAEAVDDRIAAVAAEILERDLDAGRRLPALVFGKVEHALDPHDEVTIEAGR